MPSLGPDMVATGDLQTQAPSLPHDKDYTNSESDVFIVTWDSPNDPADPFNWSTRKKLWTIGLGLLTCFVVGVNGTILSVAHQEINDDFGISDAHYPISYLPTTSWGIGGALIPLVFFPMMEDIGVRPVMLVTHFIFVCTLIPIGLAPNFATLIIARFFSGGCVAILANAVGSIISNVLHGDRARSVPINLYVTTYLTATSLGAVFGSAILANLSWRWIGHIETIFTAALYPLLIFGLPESRGSAILQARAKKLRRQGKKAYAEQETDHTPIIHIIAKGVKRPMYMLLTESVVFTSSLWSAFSLGTIYLFTQSVEQVFSGLYGWNAVQAGYAQGAIVIGEILGCGLCMIADNWYYASASRNAEVPGTPIPEARLYASIIGGFVGVTGGMLVYGWASFSYIHWTAPAFGLLMVGFGTIAVIVSIANYLIDAYSKYAASALGSVGFVENFTIGLLPLASTALYTDLGFSWASTLLAFVSLGLVAMPLVVLKWGKEIRSRSPFMKEAIFERRSHGVTAV